MEARVAAGEAAAALPAPEDTAAEAEGSYEDGSAGGAYEENGHGGHYAPGESAELRRGAAAAGCGKNGKGGAGWALRWAFGALGLHSSAAAPGGEQGAGAEKRACLPCRRHAEPSASPQPRGAIPRLPLGGGGAPLPPRISPPGSASRLPTPMLSPGGAGALSPGAALSARSDGSQSSRLSGVR